MTNEKELKSEFAKTFNLDILVDDPRANRYVSLKANDILDFFLSKFHSHTQEVVAKAQEAIDQERQFMMNVLDGIDIADAQMQNEGGGTKAIRFALSTRAKPNLLALLKEDNKPQKTAGTWKGKELNEMSKEELIKALEHLNGLYLTVLQDNNK